MELTKTLAKQIENKDFIPDGKRLKFEDIEGWRETTEYEILYCCVQIDDDIQSGPIYCGKVADYTSVDPNYTVHLCSMHSPRRLKNEVLERKYSQTWF